MENYVVRLFGTPGVRYLLDEVEVEECMFERYIGGDQKILQMIRPEKVKLT